MADIEIPDVGKQVFVAAFSARIRRTGMRAAVARAAASISPSILRLEIVQFVPDEGLESLQGTGVRDEFVFAAPSVMKAEPATLAYYRLLLGISQKRFYSKKTGLAAFRGMEEKGEASKAALSGLDDLCLAVNVEMAKLVSALPHATLGEDVRELPLLTLGAQADGSWRTLLGSTATREVFDAMKAIIRERVDDYAETASSITVANSSGREAALLLSADPDAVIREDFGASVEYKAAIEIKGGSDVSNVHNRAGEAEKSHQKAVKSGAGTCWTIISLSGVDLARVKSESPTTREWIDIDDVRRRSGETWDRLVRITSAAMGI